MVAENERVRTPGLGFLRSKHPGKMPRGHCAVGGCLCCALDENGSCGLWSNTLKEEVKSSLSEVECTVEEVG